MHVKPFLIKMLTIKLSQPLPMFPIENRRLLNPEQHAHDIQKNKSIFRDAHTPSPLHILITNE